MFRNIVKRNFSSEFATTIQKHTKKAISLLNEQNPDDQINDFYSKLWSNCDYSVQIKVPNVIEGQTVDLYFSRYKYLHQIAIGPFRVIDNCSQEINDSLAKLHNYQTYLYDFPYAGASASIKFTPKNSRELSNIVKNSIIELCRLGFMNPNKFIPGNDLGVNRQTMGYISQLYSSLFVKKDNDLRGSTTSKPLNLGGAHGSENAIGNGIAYILNHYLNDLEILKKYRMVPGLNGKKVIIQGFGEVGSSVAKVLYEEGALIVGIAEKEGCIYNPSGINIPEFKEFFRSCAEGKNSLNSFQGGKFIEGNEVIYKDCDIFIPAYKETVISRSNVHKFKFKIIVEAAWGAVTYEAEEAMLKDTQNPIFVIPDLIACGGSLIASAFEIYKDQTRQGNPMESIEGITGSYKMILDIFEANNIHFTNIDDVKEKWANSFDLHNNLLKNAIEGNIQPVLNTIDGIISNSDVNISLRTAAYSIVMQKLKRSYQDNKFTI